MIARPGPHAQRHALALDFTLSHGRHGATARLEIHERPHPGPGPQRIARLALNGWLDDGALHRLDATFDDLVARGVDQLLLDCAQLRHLDYRTVPTLVDSLARFESRAGGFVVCGLSRHLRDLFRLAGCEPRLRCWPSASDLLESAGLISEPSGEHAS